MCSCKNFNGYNKLWFNYLMFLNLSKVLHKSKLKLKKAPLAEVL